MRQPLLGLDPIRLLSHCVDMLGLLTLVERKLVLKQGSKSSSVIEKKKNGEEVKAVDSWQKVFIHSTVLGNLCTFSYIKQQFLEVQVCALHARLTILYVMLLSWVVFLL